MNSRALAAIRISVQKDESTSPERQDRAIRLKATELRADIVGTASDLNVSASKVQPFKRPQLGQWLNHRDDEFDTVIWWRMDRAIRSMNDLAALMAWAEERGKRLVFCEGHGANQSIDFRPGGNGQKPDSLAKIIGMIIAWAAEVESEANSDRVTSSNAFLRSRGEWRGGVVPYGFMPKRIPKEKRGWRLVHNPATYPIVREIVDRVISGDPLLVVCNDLNERQVPSPRDSWDLFKERKLKGRQWQTSGMKVILESRALRGEATFSGRLVADEDGAPVVHGPHIITESEWTDLQSAIADRAMGGKVKYEDPNPLLGVAFCARCGDPYYMKQDTQKGTVYTTLSCRSRHGTGKSCGQPTLSMKYATAVAEWAVLSLIGERPVMRKRYMPGDDRSEELARLKRVLETLIKERDDELIEFDEYVTRRKSLKGKIDAIGPNPVTHSRYELVASGQTYGEVWPRESIVGRRKLMSDIGLRVFLGRGGAAAAEAAYESQGSDVKVSSFYGSRYLGEPEVNNLLEDLQDGKRVKKDFRVWVLQSHEKEVKEVPLV